MGIIYKATNKLNNKVYIGLTNKSLDQRKRAHIARVEFGSEYHFHNAIRKYGIESFNWEIIEKNIIKKDDLDRLEAYYIKEFNSIKEGYNISTGGGGGDNITNHPNKKEICKKMSIAQMGKKMTPVVKEKWYKKMYIDTPDRFKGKNNPMYGKKLSEERKRQISEQHKGNTYMKGKHLSEKTKKKISISLRGRPKSDEFKEMVSSIHKGKVLSAETKKKISDTKQKNNLLKKVHAL